MRPDPAVVETFLRYARLLGRRPNYRSDAEVAAMYRHAEAIIYPKRVEGVMEEE